MLLGCFVLLSTLSTIPAARATPPISPAWQRAAELLHSAMNESADPCDDFYQFACGNWPKLNPIPPKRGDFDALLKLFFEVNRNVTKLLHGVDPNKQPVAVKKAKIYFDACIGKTTRGDDLKYIVKRLDKYGKWPLISQDWKGPVGGPWKNKSALNGRLMGTTSTTTLIYRSVQQDTENHPERMLLGLVPRSPYRYPPTVDQIVGEVSFLARKLANASGIALDEKILHQDATDVAMLEINLCEILGNQANKEQHSPVSPSHIFNLSYAIERWPFWDWRAMLSAAAVENIPRETILAAPLYFPKLKELDKLGPLIKTVPDRVMQSLLLWRFVKRQVHYIPHQDSHGKLELIPRTKMSASDDKDVRCASDLISSMPWATGRLYVDQWVKNHASKTRQMLDDMLGFVITAFKGNVHKLAWMDEKSKIGAYRKVDNVVRNVAYNDWILEDAVLNEHYKGLNITDDDDTFMLMEKMSRFVVWKMFQKLAEPVDRTDMGDSPAYLNAWYSPELNSITFPASIINEPVVLPNGPMTVNFGAMGTIMGHELNHGFDTHSIGYGPFGGHNETRWMTKRSMKFFNKMAECIVDQYDHFCFKRIEMCVNGTNTVNENIADNGGFLAAYHAYQSWLELSGGEPQLPKPMSNYSLDQIFFLSLAHNWCGNITDDRLKYVLKWFVHSPDHVRVTQTLRNMPQFARAFACKAGSGMVPKHRCFVWAKPQD